MSIKDLAYELAAQSQWDHLMSDRYFGYPDEDNEAEMQEDFERRLPRAMEKARKYAKLLRKKAQ